MFDGMKTKNKEVAKEMYEHICSWQSSQLEQKQYCIKVGLSYSRFKYWKQKYYKEQALCFTSENVKTQEKSTFIPITVYDQTVEHKQITIQYPNGVSIHYSDNISSEDLAKLIHLY